MIYLVLMLPLIFTIAISAWCMLKISSRFQSHHYRLMNVPRDREDSAGASASLIFGGPVYYYNDTHNLVCSIAELPFDLEFLEKLNDSELNYFCSRRRYISRRFPLAIAFTLITVPGVFVYQILQSGA